MDSLPLIRNELRENSSSEKATELQNIKQAEQMAKETNKNGSAEVTI